MWRALLCWENFLAEGYIFTPALTEAEVGGNNIATSPWYVYRVWLSAWQSALWKRPGCKRRINTKPAKQRKKKMMMMPLLAPALVRIEEERKKQRGKEKKKLQDSWISIESGSLWSGSWYQRDSSRSSERRWWHGKPFVTDLLGSSLLGSSLLGRLKLLVPVVKMDKN